MKKKIDYKEIIKKNIENRHNNVLFIEVKNNQMRDRDLRRTNCNDIVTNIQHLPPKNSESSNNPIQIVDDKVEPLHCNEVIKAAESQSNPISIIITAYQSQNYIEECLDSIENQTYFINNKKYEVLVGIDCCQETLNKLIEIHHKYNNVRLFMMTKNYGTYITTNTLLSIAKYENIIRFDSDDVMNFELVNSLMPFINDFDVIQFKYIGFNLSILKSRGGTSPNPANGAIFYKKKVIKMSGGYLPWKCAADYEFLKRIEKYVKIKIIKEFAFYRRMHDNSLTSLVNFGSFKKKMLGSVKQSYGVNDVKIKTTTGKYCEIIVVTKTINR